MCLSSTNTRFIFILRKTSPFYNNIFVAAKYFKELKIFKQQKISFSKGR